MRFIVGPIQPESPTDVCDVKLYRQGHQTLKELSEAIPTLVLRPWPYLFTSDTPKGKETWLVIFCGQEDDVVSEEVAWSRYGTSHREIGGAEEWEQQPPAVRRLNALNGQVRAWIKGPGSHHRSG